MGNWSDQSGPIGGNPVSHPGTGGQPSSNRTERARTRRAALLDAACVAVGDRGRAGVRVADVIALAGVSRNGFYREFASAEQCVEVMLTRVDEQIGQELDGALSDRRAPAWSRFERAVSGLARLAEREPDAFRAWMIDDYVTPAGRRRVTELRRRLEAPAADALSGGNDPLPATMVTAIVGGMVLILQSRAAAGDATSLPELVPELLGWAMSYRPPSKPLLATVSPSAGIGPPSAVQPDPDAPEARILLATTELAAERGLASVRVKDVAHRARVSLRTFYSRFDGLEQAFLSAVERHERRLLRSAFDAYRGQPSWPLAVDASLRVLCEGLADEPDLARVSGLGAHEGGPGTRDRLAQTVAALRAFLRAGHRHHPEARRFASEGIAATLAFTFHEHARSGRPELVRAFAPTATFLALSPFLPVVEATRIARRAP